VAICEDRVMVGTPSNDYSGLADAGAAYLFSAATGDLLLTVNPTPADGNQFGHSVAAAGNTFVAGAPLLDRAGATDTGAAYVYRQVDTPRRSAIVAQGRVVVTAESLNVNGLIQSGVQALTLHVAPTFTATSTSSLLDQDGNPLPGISFGQDGVPVDAWFDAAEQAIVVDDIVARGGEIILAGKILSTGNGQLRAAHGYVNLDIDNQSQYDLILNRIDTTKRREGKITIVDTARLQKAEYAVFVDTDGVQKVREILSQGRRDEGQAGGIGGILGGLTYDVIASQTHVITDPIAYQPRTGLQYVWTEGQEKSRLVTSKYEKKSFNLIGFDWDGLVADTSYKWQTVTFRDAFPLLESEVLAGRPDYDLTLLAEDFDGGDVSSWKANPNPYASHWTVVDEGDITPPSNWFVANQQLVQTSNIYGGGRASGRLGTYLLYEDPAGEAYQWQDYELQVDLYCTDNDGIGVMFRYQDGDNYYKLDMDQQSPGFTKLFKMAGGVEQELVPVRQNAWVTYPSKQWFRLAVRAEGGEIQVLVDGVEIRAYSDTNAPLLSGTVAMYSWGQQNAHFDRIQVNRASYVVSQLDPGQIVMTAGGSSWRYQGPAAVDFDLGAADLDDSNAWVPEIAAPDYADGSDYTIQYVVLDDTDVDLIPNVDIVKVVENANQGGTVDNRYLYIGPPAELVLSDQDYADPTQWEDVTATTTDAQVTYRSSFKNFTYERQTWVTGGGWLTTKTYHTLIEQSFGQKDYYTHTLRADWPIAISYLQAPVIPAINITAAQNVYLREPVSAASQAVVSLTSVYGDVVFEDAAVLLGASPTIQAGGAVRVNVEGGSVASGPARAAGSGDAAAAPADEEDPPAVSITSAGDVDIRVVYDPAGNRSSLLIVGQIESTDGDVTLHAPGGIRAQDASSYVYGNRVELVSVNGAIGSSLLPLRVDSDRQGSGGLTARAYADIFIAEMAGDLKLVAPQDEVGTAASVYSEHCDVTLHVASGAILDATPESETRTQEELDALNSEMQLSGPAARAAAETAMRSEESHRTELYHEYWREYREASPSGLLREIVNESLDTDGDVILFTEPHALQQGDQVFCSAEFGAGREFAYYVVVVSETAVQLARTRYDAVIREEPEPVDITAAWGAGPGDVRLLVYDYDYTALADLPPGEVPEEFREIHETYGQADYDPDFVFQFTPEQWQAGIDARTFSAEALGSPVAASLFAFLYADTVSGTGVPAERPNVAGRQITLQVGQGQLVGRQEAALDIDLTAGFENLDDTQRQTLAAATQDDVLAVQYAAYQYLGSAGEVDLAKADFADASLWLKQMPDHVTTGRAQWEWIEVGDVVQVTMPLNGAGQRQFGVYRYGGEAAGLLDLSQQDYRASARWTTLADFDAVDGTTWLEPGDGVGRVEGLTVEVWNDIDLGVHTGLTIVAAGVAVASSGDLQIDSITVAGAVRLQAAGSIVDLGTGQLAMSNLTAKAGQDVILSKLVGPLTIDALTAGLGNVALTVTDTAGPNDTLTLASGTTLRADAGSVTITAGDGVVVPADSRIAAAETVSITVDAGDADLAGGNIEVWGWIDADATSIAGGAGNDVVALRRVTAGNDTLVVTGEGNDQVHVGNRLDDVRAQLDIDAGLGDDQLMLRDDEGSESTGEQAGQVTTERISGFGMPADVWIEYQGFRTLAITTGAARDLIEVLADNPLQLNLQAGGGEDFVDILQTGSGSLTQIDGGNGDDTVRIHAADARGPVYFLGAGHGAQGDRLLFGPQGYATEPAEIEDPLPAQITSLHLLDEGGNAWGPTHTFSTVEHVLILAPPTEMTLAPETLVETTDTGGQDVEVGRLAAVSQTAGATCAFRLVSGGGDEDNGSFFIVGDRLFLRQGTLLDYEAQASYSLRVRADDGWNQVDTQLEVLVSDVNEPPEVAEPLSNQAAMENVPFTFQFLADAFRDPDIDDVLTYSARRDGGAALPAWLSFDAATRTFSGRPGFTDAGPLVIVVQAADRGTPPLIAETFFALAVSENPTPWQNPLNSRDVTASGHVDAPFPVDVLTLITFLNTHGILQLPAPPSPLGPVPYVDITGDGWASPVDLLDLITFINARAGGGAGGEAEPGERLAADVDATGRDGRVPDAELPGFTHGDRARHALQRSRESVVSQIMATWKPAEEALNCILAPSDAAWPCLRAADMSFAGGLADNWLSDSDEEWELLEHGQRLVTELVDTLLGDQ
jgi:hypothetical protein